MNLKILGLLAVKLFITLKKYLRLEDKCCLCYQGKIKVKQSHYRPVGPRGCWEVKASRFRDIGT
jgi:hypothetical protein